MAKDLKPGDAVKWKSHGGEAHGKVIRKVTRPITIKGHKVAAAQDNPEFLVETDDGKRAAIYETMATLLDESSSYILLTHGVQLLLYREGIVPGVTPDGNRLSFSKFRKA